MQSWLSSRNLVSTTPRRSRGRAVVPALLLAIASSGCKPKEGGKCSGGAACADEHTELACVDGKYAAMPCRGQDGCVASDNVASCDIRGNSEGDPCVAAGASAKACTADGKTEVECVAGKTKVTLCDGPMGCTGSGESTSCNRMIRLGDACAKGAGDSCLNDKKTWAVCEDGKWTVQALCRGPRGCGPFMGTISCDTSLGEVGDPCIGTSTACSVDGHAALECKDGHLAKDRDCKGPTGCSFTKGGLSCDEGTTGKPPPR
jgi:hypothetical protein